MPPPRWGFAPLASPGSIPLGLPCGHGSRPPCPLLGEVLRTSPCRWGFPLERQPRRPQASDLPRPGHGAPKPARLACGLSGRGRCGALPCFLHGTPQARTRVWPGVPTSQTPTDFAAAKLNSPVYQGAKGVRLGAGRGVSRVAAVCVAAAGLRREAATWGAPHTPRPGRARGSV